MTDGDGDGDGDDAVTGGDDLYGLDPATFTAARNTFVKRLKASGRRDEAVAVAGLRRPVPTAWALNRVARTEPDLVDDVLTTGADLRRATDAALGGEPSELRDASAAERAASAALVSAAADLLGAGSQQAKPRLAATVRAAILDEAVADELQRGVLSTDHDRSGLGLGSIDEAEASPPGRHLRVVRTPSTARTRRRPAGRPPGDEAISAATDSTTTDATTPDTAAVACARDHLRASPDPAEPDPRVTAEDARRRDAEQRAHRRQLHELRSLADRAAKRADRLGRDAEAAEEVAAHARTEADGATAAAADAARALADLQADPPG